MEDPCRGFGKLLLTVLLLLTGAIIEGYFSLQAKLKGRSSARQQKLLFVLDLEQTTRY
jgi:hypothetical protein